MRQKPYSVILFDEVEKAHPDVFNILLQIMEDGRLTDSDGRVVNFKNTIIVMTSNAGAHTIIGKQSLGFGGMMETVRDYEKMKERIIAEVKDIFRPEFINRVDELIVFHALEADDIEKIAALMLDNVAKRLEEQNMSLRLRRRGRAPARQRRVRRQLRRAPAPAYHPAHRGRPAQRGDHLREHRSGRSGAPVRKGR